MEAGGDLQVPDADTDLHIQPPTSSFIDFETFDQILEMDDEGDDSFSRGIVSGFVEQAQTTFDEMEGFMFVPRWVFARPLTVYADP